MKRHDYLRSARDVHDHLTRIGEEVLEDGGRLVVSSVAGELTVEWPERGAAVYFTLATGVRPAPLQLPQLAAINSELVVTGFRLVEGQVVFRTHAYLDGERALSSLVLERSIQACRATVSNYRDELEALAHE